VVETARTQTLGDGFSKTSMYAGRLLKRRMAKMAYCKQIVKRLSENADVLSPSRKACS